MSLVSTLGKVAMGVIVAKGMGKMMGGGTRTGGGGGGSIGDLLGGALGGSASRGGATQSPGDRPRSGGGLGDLGALLGGRGGSGSGGGLAGGGLGGLLEAIGGGRASTQGDTREVNKPSPGSLGDLLNSSLHGDSMPEPDPEQEAHARILIEAMINAAKSDGKIDRDEQAKIVEHLGEDVTAEERSFVLEHMQKPLDLDEFLGRVPSGSEQQVYMMSLMGIDLDTPAEAQYLDQLRKGMGLSESACDDIHRQLGVGTLYS